MLRAVTLRSIVVGLATPFLMLLSDGPAFGQECTCAGKLIGGFAGGDGHPLNWAFQAWLKREANPPTPRLYCYLKRVENRSGKEVRDVRWLSAAYIQRLVPANFGLTSCSVVAGEMSSAPQNGPLNYGPSSQSYETTVQGPQNGWPTAETTASSGRVNLESLRSEFAFFVRDSGGRVMLNHVSVTSSATRDGSTAEFSYEITNNGEQPINVLLNLPVNGAIAKEIAFVQKPTRISAGEKLRSKYSIQDAMQFTTATVAFYDEKGEIVAAEAAGVYAPAHEKPWQPAAKFWPLPPAN